MPAAPADRPALDAEAWRRALSGDRDAFTAAVAPHQDGLLAAAERQVEIARASGALPESALNATALVGETLVRAWEHRDRYDERRMGFRAWLLGVQYRAMDKVVRRERLYAERKAVSLSAEVPVSEADDAVEEALYEFRQPFEVVTYADLIAGSQPVDVSLDPEGNEPLTDAEQDALDRAGLSPEARGAVFLHDEMELSIAETAQILDASLKDTAESLNLARVSARQAALGAAGALPEDPTDATDSYTGDPVP